MRGGIAAIGIFALLAPAMAPAMSAPAHQRFGQCELVGGERLAALPGGGAGLCTEIERAIKQRAPSASYHIVINVLTSSRLSAVPVVNGKSLPAQNFAVMDGELSQDSVKRFAAAIGEAVLKASHP